MTIQPPAEIFESDHACDSSEREEPLCPVFGECGGCEFQDRTYEAELRQKETELRTQLAEKLDLEAVVFDPIQPSPDIYHSRSRVDLTFLKIRSGETFLGFMPRAGKRIVPVDACPIARTEISNFIPELAEKAREKMPPNYRTANLVVKTGDDGRVVWGGIGRRSLVLCEEDYLWTVLNGRRIYYSLDTFFQANLGILPSLIDRVEEAAGLNRNHVFLDLYAGVGLFAVALADRVKRVIMVEEVPASVRLAEYNIRQHGLAHAEILKGRVEERLPHVLERENPSEVVALVDPPRRGLSETAILTLAGARRMSKLLYLSCHPGSLSRDLEIFSTRGWKIRRIMPFDFFPRTRHLETLVLLEPEDRA